MAAPKPMPVDAERDQPGWRSSAGMDAATSGTLEVARPRPRLLNVGPSVRVGSNLGVRHLPAPGEKVDRYVVRGRLPMAGGDSVFEAFDPILERKVVLKLIPMPGAAAGRGPDGKMVARARSFAGLSVASVVTVFDVGLYSRELFLAMQLVEGCSLADWLSQRAHGWGEIVETLCRAGEALGALHALGLTHAGFEAEHVMVKADGTVRLVGIRLDLENASAEGDPANSGSILELSHESVAIDASTPMADIHGFCATMRAAIDWSIDRAHARPLRRVAARVDRRRQQLWVPRSLRDYLRRLVDWSDRAVKAQETGARPPDLPTLRRGRPLREWNETQGPLIQCLVEELRLASETCVRGRVRRSATVAVVAAATMAARAMIQPPNPVCEAASDRASQVWDGRAAAEVQSQFLASGVLFAGETARDVVRRLDQRMDAWRDVHSEICAADRADELALVSGFANLQMHCLHDQLAATEALVSTFRSPTNNTVTGATSATDALGSIEDCRDRERLDSRMRLPTEPKLRESVLGLREQLAQLRVLSGARELQRVAPVLEAVRNALPRVDYAPVHAEAKILMSRMALYDGRVERSRDLLEESLVLAIASSHRHVAAEAAILQIYTEGYMLADYGRAGDLIRRANAFVEAAGDEIGQRSEVVNYTGIVVAASQSLREAKPVFETSVELAEVAHGVQSTGAAVSKMNLALTLNILGDLHESAALLREVVTVQERVSGKHHSVVTQSRSLLASVLYKLGDVEESLAQLKQAEDSCTRLAGPEQPICLDVDISETLATLGRTREAARYADYLHRIERRRGTRLFTLGSWTELTLAQVELARGNAGYAADLAAEALARLRDDRNNSGEVDKADAAALWSSESLLAEALWASGQPRAALDAAERAGRALVDARTVSAFHRLRFERTVLAARFAVDPTRVSPDEARALSRRAMTMLGPDNVHRWPFELLRAEVERAHGDVDAALQAVDTAIALAGSLGHRSEVVALPAMDTKYRFLVANGQHEAARSLQARMRQVVDAWDDPGANRGGFRALASNSVGG